MLKILRRPWLHFLVLGYILFLANEALNPKPLPMVGPLSQARQDVLLKQWFSTARRAPSATEENRLFESELDRDILFQEALKLGVHRYDNVVRQRLLRNMRFLRMADDRSEDELYKEALRMELHLGDEVIKRRLIQVMEQLLLASRGVPEPTEQELVARFESEREALRRPARYSIEQVYLPRERRDEVDGVLARIKEEAMTPAQAVELSSPFLPGYRFMAHSPAQLARQFGAAFVLNLEMQEPEPGQWVGPIESTYGYHLVWVAAIEPARDAELDEVRQQLQRDLALENRRRTLAEATRDVRQGYEVVL